MPVIVPAAAHASAPVAPFNEMSVAAGNVTDPSYTGDYYFDGAQFTPGVSTVSGTQTFTGQSDAAGDSAHGVSIQISPMTSFPAAPATLTVGTDVSVYAAIDSDSCYASSGTVSLAELVTDGSGNITAFAADLTNISCGGGAGFDASVRFNSSVNYDAVSASPRTWNFGDQFVKTAGIAKMFSFTNTGVDPVTFGTPLLHGNIAAYQITTTSPSCASAVPAGGSCQITITPDPQSQTNAIGATLELPVTSPSGTRSRYVRLSENGQYDETTYIDAGPQQAQLTIGALPMPVNAAIDQYRVDWGTSPSSLTNTTNVAAACCGTPVTQQFTNLTAAQPYYFRITPEFSEAGNPDLPGDQTNTMAIEPWPTYSPGMYHAVGQFRLVSNHTVVAGHPYITSAAGTHSIPTSHVEAVVLNVTVTKPTATTNVYVYPYGAKQPSQPDLTVSAGATRSNFVLAQVSTNGRFVISTSHGSTPVSVDVSGYFSNTDLTTVHTGSALHEFIGEGTLLDTKHVIGSPLPGGYYVTTGMNGSNRNRSHIRALLVTITAYGSSGSGAITAWPAAASTAPSSTVLSYSPNTATSTLAIVPSSPEYGSDGLVHPYISFLNRGKSPVQLMVTSEGYFDDGKLNFGSRYHPKAPVHLLSSTTLSAGVTHAMSPGTNATDWTVGMNLKVTAGAPTSTTSVGMWPYGFSGLTAPAQPQLHALAHVTTVASTFAATGVNNRIGIRNNDGSTVGNVWSFGRFDMYPLPLNTQDYVGPSAALASVINGDQSFAVPVADAMSVSAASAPAGLMTMLRRA